MERRPIAARSTGWARWLASRLTASSITPNQISGLSVVVAVIGGLAMVQGHGWIPWLAAALCVQLRLLCNLLDGMVAIEGGKSSAVGALYNEFPDRAADTILITAAGYAAGMPSLGWAVSLFAVLTAYVRVFGGALGLPQNFSGIMAKQRRMAVLTAGLVAQSLESAISGTRYCLAVTLAIIALGSLVTCWTRTSAIAKGLEAR